MQPDSTTTSFIGEQESSVKIKTLISIPLIVAALAYFGLKGFIYYKVKTELDKMIQTASPFLQIDYSGISSDLNGVLSIDRVLLTPTGSYDEISIQQLKISGDGPKFLFDLVQGFNQNTPPEQMSITIQRLESPISSSFLSKIGSSFSSTGNSIWKDHTDSCSLAGIFKASGLKELGFPELTIDAVVGYHYDQEDREVVFNVNYDLAGVESSRLSLNLSGLTSAGMLGLGTPPELQQLRLIRDIEPGYMRQMVTMCAANAQQTPDQFINSVVSRPAKYHLKNLGFIPGPGLSTMFKQLISQAGRLDIQAAPSSSINPANLSAYKPSDLVDLLGITVSYNNVPVKDLSFSTRMQRKPRSTQPATETAPPQTQVEQQGPAAQTTPAPRKRPKPRYIETDIAELEKYLLYRVRIYTLDNDNPKQGVLVSIENQTINVEELLHSGKMTVHLHRSRISRVEVLRSER